MHLFVDLFEKDSKKPFETVDLGVIIDVLLDFVKKVLANEFNVEF